MGLGAEAAGLKPRTTGTWELASDGAFDSDRLGARGLRAGGAVGSWTVGGARVYARFNSERREASESQEEVAAEAEDERRV